MSSGRGIAMAYRQPRLAAEAVSPRGGPPELLCVRRVGGPDEGLEEVSKVQAD